MTAVLWRYALASYFAHSVCSQGPATVTFSQSAVLSGDPVALTCSYGSGLVLAYVTLDAYNGTQKVGFLRCSAASGNTTGFGVLSERNFTGCPTFTSGATGVSVTMRATSSLQLNYNCSARVIDSKGNALTVTSASASLVVFPAKSAECGSLVSGFGLLQSVNYPDFYINNHSCSWTLQASSPRGLISLQFLAFTTEFDKDVVQIYSQNGTLMFSYSGAFLPPNVNIRSLSTVVFTTNAVNVNSGFSIAVSTIAEPQACGNLVSGFGLLQSVNYPNSYDSHHHCSWTLKAFPISGLLHLKFLTFATESGYDFLRIYSEGGALMFSYSGTSLPPSLTLGSQVTVTFGTDEVINDRGFSIAVTTLAAPSLACGSLVSGFGLLESVNYPSYYVNSYNCPWTLRASPSNGVINLQFVAFSTELDHDFVKIYDQYGGLTASYSGTSLPPSMTLGSQAAVIFTSDYSYIISKGFSIAVSTIASYAPVCGSLVNGSGLLQSVNYPISYDNSHSCVWTLQASPGSGFLYLDFQTFATEPNCDVLSIYNESGDLTFSYSGTELPKNFWLGSQARVIFTTDSSVVNSGFSIAVSTIVLPSPPKFVESPITFNENDNATVACDSRDGKPAAVLRIVVVATSGRQVSSDSSELLLPPPLVDWNNAVVTCSVTNHNFPNLTVSGRVTINYHESCELCWIIASAVGGVILISIIIGLICKRVRSAKGKKSAPSTENIQSEILSSKLSSVTIVSKEADDQYKNTGIDLFTRQAHCATENEYDYEAPCSKPSSLPEVSKEMDEYYENPDTHLSSSTEQTSIENVYDDGESMSTYLNLSCNYIAT